MNKTLRILHLSESTGWSGGGVQLVALASGLKAEQQEILIGCPAEGELHKFALKQGFETFDFSPFQDYDMLAAWRLARLIQLRKVDIVHAHHPRAHAVALTAKYLCPAAAAPALIVSRRVSHPMRKASPFSILKYRSEKIDAYVAVSISVKKILTDFGVAPERIRVIYSGVDTNRFTPRPPDPHVRKELKTDLPVIGLIGNYSPGKGQQVLLKAAAKFLESGRKAVFLFAGRDTDSPQLLAMAQVLGVPRENLRLLGFRTDVPELLSTLSVSINAAISGEALSGSIRESLAMGVPVVSSAISGNGEIVLEGKTGSLFPPGDSTRLAELLMEYMDHPAHAREMTCAGQQLVQEKCSMRENLEQTLRLYREVCP